MRDLAKLIVAKGLKKLPNVQKIAQSGHTGSNLLLLNQYSRGSYGTSVKGANLIIKVLNVNKPYIPINITKCFSRHFPTRLRNTTAASFRLNHTLLQQLYFSQSCLFSVDLIDFPEFLQNKFYNINYRVTNASTSNAFEVAITQLAGFAYMINI